MPVDGYSTKGTELQILDKAVSPVARSTIGGITDMPAVNNQKSTLEDTALDDLNRHYRHGIGEPPSITLTLYWDPDESPQNDLEDAYHNETELDFLVSLPDSPVTEFEFKSLITGYSTPYGGINAMLQQDVIFQLNENDNGDIVTKNPTL